MSEKGEAKSTEIAEAIGLQPSRTKDYLKPLVDEGVLIAEGEYKSRIYRIDDSDEM